MIYLTRADSKLDKKYSDDQINEAMAEFRKAVESQERYVDLEFILTAIPEGER